MRTLLILNVDCMIYNPYMLIITGLVHTSAYPESITGLVQTLDLYCMQDQQEESLRTLHDLLAHCLLYTCSWYTARAPAAVTC